ncbi:MAG: hypothetical protein ACOYU3_07825 [Bacillota bacterium]
MDNIRTCRWCRKIYRGYGEHFCPECVEKMDDAFVAIRAYLDDHPNANATEIIEATGMEERIVMQLLRDERLSEYTNGKKNCEVCNKEIASGKFCDECKKMMETLVNANRPGSSMKQNPGSVKAKGVRDTSHKKMARSIRMYDE